MHILTSYYNKIIKYDLINKFHYKQIKNIPTLENVTLTFKLKYFNNELLLSSLAALKLLTGQKGVFIMSTKPNLFLKIRKGDPIGCKVKLRKRNISNLLVLILNKFLLELKVKQNNKINLFVIELSNLLLFSELNHNYHFFKNISDLTIHIKTTNCELKEFNFLIKSYKFL